MFIFGQKIKLCILSQYLYVSVITSKSKWLRSTSNLQISRWCSRTSTSEFLQEIVSESKVKDYINYLVNKYQNGNLERYKIVEASEFKILSTILDERINILDEIQNLSELVQIDVKLKSLVEEEKLLYEEDLQMTDIKLLSVILNNHNGPNYTDIIIEIQAGVGGNEAALFVSDLYNMYIGHAKYLGLTHHTILNKNGNQGECSHVAITMSGDKAFEKLRYEGGVHRVQRIPSTERAGRIHTSTASVAVIPLLSNENVQLKPKDLKIETKRASGAGGQHVNCTNSAVRIVHIPTGMTTTCQVHKSQIKNKELALQQLRSMLCEKILKQQREFQSNLRSEQFGLGMRNERIRTYNFQQDRVTDHRLVDGTTHNIKNFLNGGRALDDMENKLNNHMKKKLILNIIENTNYFEK